MSDAKCILCREALLKVGQKSDYGATIIFKIGDSEKNGWFATLSPRTGGNPEKDFSIQIMPIAHLINFSQINDSVELAKNYGLAFAKISAAASKVIEKELKKESPRIISLGTYGKCKHENEHIHIKLFPYRGDIGQPFTVDSSYQKKEVYKDAEGAEFVKMKPIRKIEIHQKRFNELVKLFISSLR